MLIAALALIALIAALHLYIAYFEIFAWQVSGPEVFDTLFSSPEMYAETVNMAANQGLYNGFLAVGLFWSLFIRNRDWQRHVATFFLLCVAVAGVFGAFTISPRIALIQTVPSVLALMLLYMGSRRAA